MLDVGWPELLVIAIVLIVVVGPKDLPPMLRAFGKMTGRLRTMAGEFRSQFDEALKEADLDDVRKTIADAQKLNPVNSLKDAMNPLRQMGADIRNDLQKAVKSEPPKAPEMSVPEPFMKLPDEPPVVASTPAVALEEAAAEPVSTEAAKPARKARAAKSVKTEAVAAPVEKTKPQPRKAQPKKVAAVETTETPVAAKVETPSAVVRKPAAEKKVAEAAKPAAVKKPAAAKKPATPEKTAAESADKSATKSTAKTTGKSKKTSDA